jgi:hypothetical protein
MEGERGRDSFLGWPRGRICAASRFSTSARRGRAASSAARGVSGLFAFHVPNGGWRTRTEGAILKGAGVVAGVPDIILINAGRTYALELKADGRKLSTAQRETMAAMERAGATVAHAVGLDAALAQLEG